MRYPCTSRGVCQAPPTVHSASLRTESDPSSTGLVGYNASAVHVISNHIHNGRNPHVSTSEGGCVSTMSVPVAPSSGRRQPRRRLAGAPFGENPTAAATPKNFVLGVANRGENSGFVLLAAESAARRRGPDPLFPGNIGLRLEASLRRAIQPCAWRLFGTASACRQQARRKIGPIASPRPPLPPLSRQR